MTRDRFGVVRILQIDCWTWPQLLRGLPLVTLTPVESGMVRTSFCFDRRHDIAKWWGKLSHLIGGQRYDFAGRAPLPGDLAAGANFEFLHEVSLRL
jgi:hypothetical protein